MMKKIVLAFSFVWLAAAPLLAQDIRVPEDYDTIQEAVDNADAGDVIRVADGVYEENVVISEIRVNIVGNSGDPEQAVIDGEGDGAVVEFHDNQGFPVLDGFTIRNGSDNRQGGGIICDNARPTLRNLIITGCSGEMGGGIYGDDCSSTLDNVVIRENAARGNGGGIYLRGQSEFTIENCLIAGNVSQTNRGGGIANFSSVQVRIRDSRIAGNTSSRDGGGVFSQGAIFLTGVEIDSNASEEGSGGGLWANGTVQLLNVSLLGNSAQDAGGGMYTNAQRPRIERVVCGGNVCGAYGAGFCFADDCIPNLDAATIAHNTAEEGGGGMYCSDDIDPALRNCIFWANAPNEIEFDPDAFEDSITLNYCNLQGGEDAIITNDNGFIDWGQGNIDSDPLFADPENLDFHLTWVNFPENDETKSTCIDAGDPNGDEDPDGTRMDIGCFPYFQAYPDIEVDVDAINFGDVHLGESENGAATISNTGNGVLSVELRLAEADSPFIIRRENLEFEIQPEDEAIVVIAFEPESQEQFENRLIIISNDPDENEQVIGVDLQGRGIGSPPEIIGEIEDLEILEDSDWTFVADLSEVFRDPDGDSLRFSYRVGDDFAVSFEVRIELELFLKPAENRWIQGTEIEVVCRSGPENQSASSSFVLTVHPMNDLPGGFSLLQPADNANLTADSQTFSWQEATQNQWELDIGEVTYDLHFYCEMTDLEYATDPQRSTMRNVRVQTLIDSLELTEFDVPYEIDWWAVANDDSGAVESDERWAVIFENSEVPEFMEKIPSEFVFHQNYPNPFNAETTIRFGLPVQSYVKMIVFDMLGNRIAVLADARMDAGYHSLNWDGKNLESGIYMVRMNAGGVEIVRGVVLIR